MKTEENNKKVNKVSIVIAWILLIMLIVSTIVITYFKLSEPNDNLEEHPVNDNNATSPAITESLQKIVDNFNNSSLLENYRTQNIAIIASLDNTTIIISCTGTSSKTYNFEFNSPTLTTVINTMDTDENVDVDFNDIFKILVYAIQTRLNNTKNIDDYITGFLNDNLEVEGLSKEINDSSITYSIDISKTIGTNNNINDNNSLEDNNTENDTKDNNTNANNSIDNSIVNNGEEGEY